MKLSKLFHTLYAAVMGIPLLIIPIFAININQKSVEPISIEVQEKVSVDFNQLVNEDTFARQDSYTNGEVQWNIEQSYNNYTIIRYNDLILNHHYVYRNLFTNLNNETGYALPRIYVNGNGHVISTLDNPYVNYDFICSNTSLYVNFSTQYNGLPFEATSLFTLYDLDKMGLTLNEFNTYFPNPYYPYTESQKMLVDKPTPTTYDDSDIGSQFLYSLYKPVHDYFNFGKFFGLVGMYDWFQLNIFNGTAPLSFFIVFNVMIYWLFISLFWLLFDILIYVPMVIHKWLDKAEM